MCELISATDLLAGIWPAPRHWLVAALKVFFDASRAGIGPPVLAVAGYIAPGYHWDQMTPRWQQVLRREGLAPPRGGDDPRPGYHHATDAEWPYYRAYKRIWRPKFADGTETELDQKESMRKSEVFKARLIKIIEDTAIFGIGAATVVENPDDFGPAYLGCLRSCLDSINMNPDVVPRGKQILSVFEDGDGVTGAVQDMYRALRRFDAYSRFALPTPGSKLQFPPLQTADMLAFEVMKQASKQITNAGKSRVLGKQLTDRVSTETWYYAPSELAKFAWLA